MANPRRRGFTIAETLIALVAIGALGVLVAECTSLALREQLRMAANQAALELADNILEEARATPWDQLNESWAESKRVPAEMKALLPDGKLTVTVESVAGITGARRITALVSWAVHSDGPPRTVQLTAMFSVRESQKKGDLP